MTLITKIGKIKSKEDKIIEKLIYNKLLFDIINNTFQVLIILILCMKDYTSKYYAKKVEFGRGRVWGLACIYESNKIRFFLEIIYKKYKIICKNI